MTLELQVEGVLFYKAAPMKKSVLVKLLEVEESELNNALKTLSERLLNGATRLVMTEHEVELVTAPELDELIENIRKDEIKRDIGKAGAETLAIILYRGSVSRADIDRIRGVNSSFILRNLQMRGLIERTGSGRQFQFKPTTELLAHLGVTERSKLPNFSEVMNALDTYESQLQEQE